MAIYRLLDRVSPMDTDCGALCDAACCAIGLAELEEEDFNMGIYLYPGEEKIFADIGKQFLDDKCKLFPSHWLDWSTEDVAFYDYPDSWHGKVYFVRCKNPPHCPREYRPLQCRFFPLTPHIMKDGTFKLILFPSELPYECPLIRDKINLNPRFIKATYTIWKHLLRDPLIRDMVEHDSARREEEGLEIHCV